MNSTRRRLSSTAPRPDRPATNSSNSGRQNVFCTSTARRATRKVSSAAGLSACSAAHCRACAARSSYGTRHTSPTRAGSKCAGTRSAAISISLSVRQRRGRRPHARPGHGRFICMHTTTNPAILYFGTPVVLISTVNEDGSFNVAPMSSAWWLGWRCMLGLSAASKTPQNMARTGECVLNLPSADQVDAVDRLARTTGSDPVPPAKRRRGYRHVKEKFGHAGLTPLCADTVAAPRVEECPVQLEATVSAFHAVGDDDPH